MKEENQRGKRDLKKKDGDEKGKKRGVKFWGLYFGAEAVKLRTAKRKNIPVK